MFYSIRVIVKETQILISGMCLSVNYSLTAFMDFRTPFFTMNQKEILFHAL